MIREFIIQYYDPSDGTILTLSKLYNDSEAVWMVERKKIGWREEFSKTLYEYLRDSKDIVETDGSFETKGSTMEEVQRPKTVKCQSKTRGDHDEL